MILSIVLTFIAALFKSIMDFVQHRDIDSWRNKWKNGNKNQGEKFPFSSTLFVMFTDRWHLWQSLFLSTIFILVCFHEVYFTPLIDFFILRIIFGATFEIFYQYFRKL